jgi:hypothetical protein
MTEADLYNVEHLDEATNHARDLRYALQDGNADEELFQKAKEIHFELIEMTEPDPDIEKARHCDHENIKFSPSPICQDCGGFLTLE